MTEMLMLILAIVGFVLFHENRTRLKRLEGEFFALRERLDDLAVNGVARATPAQAAFDRPPEPQVDAAVDAAVDDQAMARPEMSGVADADDQPQVVAAAIQSEQTAETPIQIAETAIEKPRQSLESRLGAQWTVWVGGLALALGGLFAVKYSIDQGLLNPAVRVTLAGVFGLVLMVAGEVLRRRTPAAQMDNFRTAMIPGIVTAAGTLTLMGAIYVAHNFFGFIGPATAFVLLALVSLATIALSLLHGQTLAGLGLLASFATPALVTSTAPSPWSLFGFLTIVWLASLFSSRFKKWQVAPSLANIGLAGWALLYIGEVSPFEILPVLLPMLVMLAGIGLVWPGADSRQIAASPGVSVPDQQTGEIGEAVAAAPASWVLPYANLFLSQHLAISLTAGIGTMLVAVQTVAPDVFANGPAHWGFVALVAAMALSGASRIHSISVALLATVTSVVGFLALSASTTSSSGTFAASDATSLYLAPGTAIAVAALLAATFVAAGSWVLRRHSANQSAFTDVWAVLMTISPLAVLSTSFIYFGSYALDWTHGALGVVLAAIFLFLAGRTDKHEEKGATSNAHHVLLAGSYAALMFALIALTNGLATTIGAALIGFVYLLASRLRAWLLLPWFMVASAIFVAGRIAMEPTIVGPDRLSTTPVFNALLVGYGLPALLLCVSAYLMRNHVNDRLRNALEALASLFVLMTIAIEVRHMMHGGVLDDALPSLSEQSIYTLLAIGASATLMTLGLKRPSIIFKWGSMALGVLSMLFVLVAHLFTLNPYFSGELTGSIPVINLLLIGYLMPGIAYAILAWYARDRRPLPYVMALALSGAVLAFSYVTLSVRRFWQGESVVDWKGFLQGETYTYSVVWLILGVALLLLGYRFRAISIRIASAALVLIAVLKVFLIDMSNLEGLLRALSFIGLGIVLIGIGRFYQRVLMEPRAGATDEAEVTPEG